MPFWSKNTVPKELNGIIAEIDSIINKIEETILAMENKSISLLQNDEDKENINIIISEYNELKEKIQKKIVEINDNDKKKEKEKNKLTKILEEKSTLLDEAYNKINSSIDNKNTENYDKQFFMGGLNSKKLIQNLNKNFEELINTYEFHQTNTAINNSGPDTEERLGNPISTLSNDISNLDDDNCKSFLMELIINCIESTTVLAEAQDQKVAEQ